MAPIKVSIYTLKNGKFQVSYVDSKSHKRIRRKFHTYRQAKEFELFVQKDFNRQEAIKAHEGKSFKVESLVKLHFQSCPKSKFKDRNNSYNSFMNTFGQCDIFAIKFRDLMNWFEHLQQTNNYTEKTLSHVKAQINHFFKFLIDEQILEHNPLDNIKFKQSLPPKRSKVILSPEEIIQFLNNLKLLSPDIFYPYFYTLVHTGARRMEVANLKWEDVNLSSNILTFKNTKNGTNRTIKLSKGLRELLETQKQSQNFVFKGRKSESITNAQFYRFFQRYRKKFPDLPAFACHDLRHSFAFNFLKKGGSMYALKAILGHKSIQMTIDLYGNFKSIDVENPSPYDF